MPTTIEITLPRLHPGQIAVMRAAKRYNVLRCGRRWGKTTFGAVLCAITMLQGKPAAWLGPEDKYVVAGWDMLVEWLSPIIVKKDENKRVIILANGGRCDMYSLESSADGGRGRKFARVVYDEAGITPRLKQSWTRAVRATLADYKGDAWFLGTSKPGYPYFDELFLRGEQQRPGWASFQTRTIDNPAIDPNEIEEARLELGDQAFGEEYLGWASESSLTFFPKKIIEEYIERFCVEPAHRGSLLIPDNPVGIEHAVRRRRVQDINWQEQPKRGAWKLWTPLLSNVRVRPGRQLVIAADLSMGVGSSNSIFSVVDVDTRRKIAEMASPNITPERAADLAACAGVWLGGPELSKLPWIQFENNGPGQNFVRRLQQIQYPKVMREQIVGTSRDRETANYGWHSSTTAKAILLSAYRSGLATALFHNPSQAALLECLSYIEDAHNRVVTLDEVDDDSGARKPHADRVIADALAFDACKRIPKMPDGVRVAPSGSLAALRQRDEERKQREEEDQGY